jgi:hypothetical protein
MVLEYTHGFGIYRTDKQRLSMPSGNLLKYNENSYAIKLYRVVYEQGMNVKLIVCNPGV